MDVVALLPRHLLSHLRIVLGSDHAPVIASGWADLHVIVQRGPVDLVVADPLVTGDAHADVLEGLKRQFSSVAIVVYTSLSPRSMQAVVRLARCGVEHVVLHRFDDEPRRFLELLESIPSNALGDRMLRELAMPVSALPVVVGRAVESLFRSPGRFQNSGDLASAAGMNLRTLYRNLEPAGLYSARSLVVAARLLRAYGYLRDPGRSIKDVAAKAGYHSAWQLSRQMREMTGMTAEQVRRELDGEMIVSLLAEQVRRRRRKA